MLVEPPPLPQQQQDGQRIALQSHTIVGGQVDSQMQHGGLFVSAAQHNGGWQLSEQLQHVGGQRSALQLMSAAQHEGGQRVDSKQLKLINGQLRALQLLQLPPLQASPQLKQLPSHIEVCLAHQRPQRCLSKPRLRQILQDSQKSAWPCLQQLTGKLFPASRACKRRRERLDGRPR